MIRRLAITLAALAGCTWGQPPAVRLTAVAPATLTRGVKAILTVTGEGFEPGVVLDFDDPARATVCGAFQVMLRQHGVVPAPAPIWLRRAWLISANELRARLEGDLITGSWDVVVVDPGGREAVLPEALTVTHCGASNAQCDDGEPCTYDPTFGAPENGLDKCTGNSSCGGTNKLPDEAECSYACTDGRSVPGSCQSGACVPAAGLCDPPVCTDP
jgi:hypothetical protein